jgi:hypothetical protein
VYWKKIVAGNILAFTWQSIFPGKNGSLISATDGSGHPINFPVTAIQENIHTFDGFYFPDFAEAFSQKFLEISVRIAHILHV